MLLQVTDEDPYTKWIGSMEYNRLQTTSSGLLKATL